MRCGLEGFAPHEVLELLLYYAIPQKDTNPIAHRLLDKFGSLSGVFSARTEELCTVDGISEHAATLLRLVFPAVSCALAGEAEKKTSSFDSLAKLGEYLVRRYIGVSGETVYLVLLDNSFSLIDSIKVHEGSVNSVGLTSRQLVETALFRGAAMAVVAHNHPSGMAIPSAEDIQTTLRLYTAFEAVGIALLEHILVAGDSYTPILSRSSDLLASRPDRARFYADTDFPHEKRKDEKIYRARNQLPL